MIKQHMNILYNNAVEIVMMGWTCDTGTRNKGHSFGVVES